MVSPAGSVPVVWRQLFAQHRSRICEFSLVNGRQARWVGTGVWRQIFAQTRSRRSTKVHPCSAVCACSQAYREACSLAFLQPALLQICVCSAHKLHTCTRVVNCAFVHAGRKAQLSGVACMLAPLHGNGLLDSCPPAGQSVETAKTAEHRNHTLGGQSCHKHEPCLQSSCTIAQRRVHACGQAGF